MARILICTLGQQGHVRSTLKLARTLRERGHEVVYVSRWENPAFAEFDASSEPQIAAFVRDQGFQYVPFTELLLKRQSRDRVDRVLARMRWLQSQSPFYRGLRDFLERLYLADLLLIRRAERQHRFKLRPSRGHLLRTGGLADDLRALNPDICLVDVYAEMDIFFAVAALGVPYLRYTTTLPQGRSKDVPPIDTTLPPARDAESKRMVSRSWSRVALRKLVRPGELMMRWHVVTSARLSGLPLAQFDFSTEMSPFGFKGAPLLVFCPREFDFPRSDRPHVRYVEPSIDTEATAAGSDPFPHEWLDARRGLVLCSFGSQWRRYDAQRLRTVVRRLLETAQHCTDCQFIISAGEITSSSADAIPCNVLLRRWIPQNELLPRARVLITHGGLASIKEAIVAGVPMLVLPQDRDQLGNAARVVFHELGALLPPEPSVLDLRTAIERLAEPHDGMRSSLLRFQKIFRAAETSNLAAGYVEEYLA